MEARTIDVRGLDHGEKQTRIFPAVDALKHGETLRIVFEFNPIPLVHMFKARHEFDLSFEKEGPEEWILRLVKTAPDSAAAPDEDQKAQFKAMLREMREGKPAEDLQERAKALLKSVDAKTLGLLEQELIREGVSHDEIRKSLCDVHLEVLRDSLVKQRIEVQSPHPVHTFMEEHKLILQALRHLAEVVNALKTCRRYEDLSAADLGKLEMASHLLVEAELHHDREEQCLFPMLEKHGITEPPAIMKEEHVEFRAKKKELFQIVNSRDRLDFETFKAEVTELGGFIVRELDGHIFKEDNILYQIALQVLTDEEWGEVKRGCDKIGYCCFKPADQPVKTTQGGSG